MPHPALACALRAPRPVALLRSVLLWLCCAGAWAEPAAEPLRVVTDYWPPFRMAGRDGRVEGLDIDLLEELQRRAVARSSPVSALTSAMLSRGCSARNASITLSPFSMEDITSVLFAMRTRISAMRTNVNMRTNRLRPAARSA